MKKTIIEVAKHAGVSKTTISRYLNGKYEFMSTETRERIAKSIKELDYVPNGMARSLKNKQSKIIGCTIADIGNQFSSYIFKGISEVCQKNGYRVLVTEISNHEEDEISAIESLISYNIDGLIINTSGSNDDYLVSLVEEKNIPIVLADRSIHQKNIIDTVTINNHDITCESMKHIHENGYEEVAFFTYELTNNIRELRHDAYLESLNKYFGIKEDMTYFYEEKDKEDLERKILHYLNKDKKRKAIFCMNGKVLLEVLQSIKKLGYDIEDDDIGICSFDDWGWAELVNKEGITTISQKSYECGVKCAEVMLERIKNSEKPIEYIELPAKLIKRGSTKNRSKK
ncbi:LacI family DNA-binding transcriptional regulator [Streptobacillus felis]|uniref:LacI family DNA-binding transcriptional regulator n=1 Tax=Streptobacillus felis TaxID=1384509 RepID=A0A7Z0PE87_9FUSO|nr:LacI family DNA-binding transcriptional regulator [Streptobacillus felis]NYV27611.1 LacI family DNA-binding transcriptional regulator [Streptobacillus felis]